MVNEIIRFSPEGDLYIYSRTAGGLEEVMWIISPEQLERAKLEEVVIG